MTNRYEEASDAARQLLENFDEIDLAEMLASSNASAATLNARATELERQLADADGEYDELANHTAATCEAVADRDQAEAAIERVRQLCELTISASVRTHAVEQALDTLAALDQPQQPTTTEAGK